MHHRLSSPSSALLLNDLYDQTYNDVDPLTQDPEERVFGCTLMRDNESVEDFNELSTLLDEYHKYDILKFFGLTYLDYINITLVEKHALVASAILEMRKQNDGINQQRLEYAQLTKNAEKKANNVGHK